MARPNKETVEYFPHFCNNGKTMFIIENHFGNDGYAFWFKLLELLGNSKKHYYDCRNDTSIEFLSALTRLMPTQCIHILDKLAQLDAIDSDLWEKRIIFSQNFINNISDAYKRSNDKPFDKNSLCMHLFGYCIQKRELKEENDTESTENDTENTQSILKDIKVNKSVCANTEKMGNIKSGEAEELAHTQVLFDFKEFAKELVTDSEYLKTLNQKYKWTSPKIIQDEMRKLILDIESKKPYKFPLDEDTSKARFEKWLLNSNTNPNKH